MLENCNYAITGWAGMFYLAIGSLDRRRGGDGNSYMWPMHCILKRKEE